MPMHITAPSFEALADLPDDQIREVIARVGRDDLSIAMKAVTEHFKERFWSNMPEDQREALNEHAEWLGPMRLSEVEEVQRKIHRKFEPEPNDETYV